MYPSEVLSIEHDPAEESLVDGREVGFANYAVSKACTANLRRRLVTFRAIPVEEPLPITQESETSEMSHRIPDVLTEESSLETLVAVPIASTLVGVTVFASLRA